MRFSSLWRGLAGRRTGTRIALGGISHETNSYVTAWRGPTRLQDFIVRHGSEILEEFEGTGTYLGGAIDAVRRVGGEVIPTLYAFAEPSGLLTPATLRSLTARLLAALEEAGPVDAVLLEQHGALSAHGDLDGDGYVLSAVRGLLGPSVPVAVIFDNHGNPTPFALAACHLPLAVRHNPHSDQAERADEAIRLLTRVVRGDLRPVTASRAVDALLPLTQTYRGPGAELLTRALAAQEPPGVVDVSVFHGFPYTDTPQVGARVVATADADPGAARAAAADVADWLEANLERFRPVGHLSPGEAVRLALREAAVGRRVVINEASDNPGAGSAGNGTHLLAALLAARPEPGTAVFGFISDPAAADRAHEAGEGSTFEVLLGGSDPGVGSPLRRTALVRRLTDGRFTLTAWAPGQKVDLGRTALLEIEGVEVIVASRVGQTYCPAVFRLHGVDPAARRIVAVKSSHHFRAGFAGLADAIITCEGPGLVRSDLAGLPRRHLTRPVWPLASPERTAAVDGAHTGDLRTLTAADRSGYR